MSKKQFKSQASSSRAASSAFGPQTGAFSNSSFGSPSAFGAVSASPLSYVYEPPELGSISEPNVVVALKNLQKKDSTTKAKALEDLQSHVSSDVVKRTGIEDPILEAWIKLYPRTSIDSSRRVRQLAHTFHGELSASSGKRVAKHMPKAVGAWLTGLQDNDKLAARAAQAAFQKVFPTDDKQKAVWRVYQQPVLEYCRDAILKESVRTLSDERTTSPDDAEAKYARVVGSALLTIASVLDILSVSELQRQEVLYRELLHSKTIWKLVSYQDASVRKSTYRLLAAVLSLPDLVMLDYTVISTCLLQDALHVDQTASAYELAKSLAQLSSVCPEVWTKYYTGSGKKSATKSLCRFLQKGSQGGPPDFWQQITTILRHVPSEVLRADQGSLSNDDSNSKALEIPFLMAMHDGINRKTEHRSNQSEAWRAFLSAVGLLLQSQSDEAHMEQILKTFLVPIVNQYVSPTAEGISWNVQGNNRESICGHAMVMVLCRSPKIFEGTWKHLSSEFLQALQTSRPEQSKDYTKSQEANLLMVQRWYSLQANLRKDTISDEIRSIFEETLASELKTAVEILKARNGRPYSAAAALSISTNLVPESTHNSFGTMDMLLAFAHNDLPQLLLSPSSSYLIDLLHNLRAEPNVQGIYQTCIQVLTNVPDSSMKIKTLCSLISSPWLWQADSSENLSSIIKESLQKALRGNNDYWPLVTAAVGNPVVSHDLVDEILASMTDSLLVGNETPGALYGFKLLTKQNEAAVGQFQSSRKGATLLSRLLTLAESSDPEASLEAQELAPTIRGLLSGDGTSELARDSMFEIIRNGLESADTASLSVESLVNEAVQLLLQATGNENNRSAETLIPSATQWTEALKPFLRVSPDISLGLMNAIGGSVCLVQHYHGNNGNTSIKVSRDSNGYSSALRIAWYVTELCSKSNIFDFITQDRRTATFQQLSVFAQLASDNVSISQLDGLWLPTDIANDLDLSDLVAQVQSLLAKWSGTADIAAQAVDNLLTSCLGVSPTAYYSARAVACIVISNEDMKRVPITRSGEDHLKALRDISNPFAAVALLPAISDSIVALRISNTLIAGLTDLDINRKSTESLYQLVFLNCVLMQTDETDEIPQQRLVFFVKHLIAQLQKGEISPEVTAEIYKVLVTLLPLVKDIYGSLWKESIDIIINGWSRHMNDNGSKISLMHTSLRLCSTLRALAIEECNDDLTDSWVEKKSRLVNGLIDIIKPLANTPDYTHHPRKMVNELLGRLLTKLFPRAYQTPEELYPIIASQVPSFQHAAFTILHQQIPEQQEEASIEAVLSKDSIIKLPEELLSLILTVPSPDDSNSTSLGDIPSLQLRGYLLSWKLVFDHWSKASYKLQTDYAASIRDGTYMNSFLEFAFKFLIDSRSKPVDASRFDIEFYDPDHEDQPAKDIQWLVIHLYYLCLKNLPALSKAYWRDNCPRHLQKPVEAWTEKYISPTVILRELDTVSAWLPTQDTADAPLTVKVSPRAHELTASYPIDEQELAIRIALPPTYPLAPVLVESVHRVGIDEKKWRSWLLTTSGVINFSGTSGAVIEGLVAWRKNVIGALKGQSECAICYSVVSADKQLPSKRCGTCKNLFHGGCLFRWFRSSGSSSCPLCRNAFNYG